MNHYDDNLSQLQQRVALKKQLKAKLDDLRNQRHIFGKKTAEFREEHRSEQADVERIEGRSLANYFYQIIGKLDEKLDQERKQASGITVVTQSAEQIID